MIEEGRKAQRHDRLKDEKGEEREEIQRMLKCPASRLLRQMLEIAIVVFYKNRLNT